MKLSKKLLLATLGVSALAVSVPVVLTSCSQGTEQNTNTGNDNNNQLPDNNTGDDNNNQTPGEDNNTGGDNNNQTPGEDQDKVLNDAIATVDGNKYYSEIVVNGEASLSSLEFFITSNSSVVKSIESTLLSDTTKFNNVTLNYKGISDLGNGLYEMQFTTKLVEGHAFADGSVAEKTVNVTLNNVIFKDARATSKYTYSTLVDVNSVNKVESVQNLTDYLVANNNKEINKIIDSYKTFHETELKNVNTIELKENSVVKTDDCYELTLVAKANDKHQFENGANTKDITVHLSSVSFAQVGATVSGFETSSIKLSSTAHQYFNNAYLASYLASRTSKQTHAEAFVNSTEIRNAITTQFTSKNLLTNASIDFNSAVVKLTGLATIDVTYTVIGNGNYVFADGQKSKEVTVTITGIEWADVPAQNGAIANGSTINLSSVSYFKNKTANYLTVREWITNQGGLNLISEALKAENNLYYATLLNRPSNNTDVIVTMPTKTSNPEVLIKVKTQYNLQFASGSQEKTIVVVLTNINW